MKEKQVLFSIIVVALNPGNKLIDTINSVLEQTENDYEILIKDGGSTDGSVERIPEDEKIRIVVQKDTGIYDAMNQASKLVTGKIYFFLNCGDTLYDPNVLAGIKEAFQNADLDSTERPFILYGDIYSAKTQTMVASNPALNAFGCYRNVPCHQACFYSAQLFDERGYEPKYRVRADYEHFLWSFFEQKADTVYVPLTVCSYEGGGFSETAENRKRSEQEHKEITQKYIDRKHLLLYKCILLATLAPLRTKIAENPKLSGIYNKIKDVIYSRKSR